MGPEHLAAVQIDDHTTTALVDGGAQVNVMTSDFLGKLELPLHPLSDLYEGKITIVGNAGLRTTPLGFTIATVKINGVADYQEEHVFMVQHDSSYKAKKVPIILGTCTINRVVPMIKESELDGMSTVWEAAKLGGALAFLGAHAASVDVDGEEETAPLDAVLRLKEDVHIPPGSTLIIPTVMKRVVGNDSRMGVMSTPLRPEDSQFARLPDNVEVQPLYSTLPVGGKTISVALKNMGATSVSLAKNRPVARASEGEAMDSRDLDPHKNELWQQLPASGAEKPKLTEQERKDLLMEKLNLKGLKSWPKPLAKAAKQLLMKYHDVFSLEGELGKTDLVKHEIHLTDTQPFKEAYRRINPLLLDEVKTHVKEMLDTGAIRHSNSPWSNAIVLVRKKDGSLRFCIDFRRLNERTRKDSYPLPRIREVLDSLVGAGFFSCLDLKSGFWQAEMDEASRPYTAFTVGNMGFYECNRMPFGLSNAPATFQRLMQNCLREYNMEFCLIYLDDVIVFSKTEEEHLSRLEQVLQRFLDHNLKLKPSKCDLFKTEITYLAHHVSKDGVRPSKDNVKAILDYPEPTNYTQIRAFLGLVGHYRRFIKGFAQIAEPLEALLRGEGSKKKKEPVQLPTEAKAAFELLRDALTESPVLCFADFNKEFLLETDASHIGLGCVLSQKQSDGRFHPVAYGSRSLNVHERNYHSSKLEFLALKWAVTKHFQEYLMYKPFVVRTDNNPLTYVFTTPNLDATGHRWVESLAQANFTLQYQKGRDNSVADALSRMEITIGDEEDRLVKDDHSESEWVELKNPKVKAILEGALEGTSQRAELCRADIEEYGNRLEVKAEAKLLETAGGLVEHGVNMVQMHVTDWAAMQKQDPGFEAALTWLDFDRKGGKRGFKHLLKGVDDEQECSGLLQERDRLVVKDGLLYHKWTLPQDQEPTLRFAVPKDYRSKVFQACHGETGHQGRDRTLSLIRDRFWWPRMSREVTEKIKKCERCTLAEAKQPIAPLKPILATMPMELVHLDYTTIEVDTDPRKSPELVEVLVVQDHFTKFMMAFLTKNTTTMEVAKCLYNHLFSLFGPPEHILTDQGRNFCSALLRDLCKLLGIKKLRTSVRRPQGNGQCERACQTLKRMIGKLDKNKKQEWPKHLASIVMAYNGTRSAVSGYSPFYMMFGRRQRQAVDFLFPTQVKLDRVENTSEYIDELRQSLKACYEAARKLQTDNAVNMKKRFDRKANAVILEPGDKVLVRAGPAVGRRKIMDRWESKLFTVVSQVAPGTPVYNVTSDDGDNRVLHRSRLLSVDSDFGTTEAAASVTINRADSITYLEESYLTRIDEDESQLDAPSGCTLNLSEGDSLVNLISSTLGLGAYDETPD